MNGEERWACEHGIEEGFHCSIGGGDVGINGEPLIPVDDDEKLDGIRRAHENLVNGQTYPSSAGIRGAQ